MCTSIGFNIHHSSSIHIPTTQILYQCFSDEDLSYSYDSYEVLALDVLILAYIFISYVKGLRLLQGDCILLAYLVTY